MLYTAIWTLAPSTETLLALESEPAAKTPEDSRLLAAFTRRIEWEPNERWPLPKYCGEVFGASETRSKKFRVWFGRFSTRFSLMVVETAPVVVLINSCPSPDTVTCWASSPTSMLILTMAGIETITSRPCTTTVLKPGFDAVIEYLP